MMAILAAHAPLFDSAYWHLLPLLAVVSVVYAATRHEEWHLIWGRAIRFAMLVLGFMAVALAVLLAIQLL